jgi:ABC-type multidrug transport system fused ATPase/permease subunit
VPLAQARDAVVLAAQDSLLVQGTTVFENLTLGLPKGAVRSSEVWRVLESVGMRGAIEALPELLDEVVEGDMFSHGQRQLISLARALLSCRGPRTGVGVGGRGGRRVLLCDEPTSNVDVATDERVHETLLGLPNTVVMICHRLHYVGWFDKVAVVWVWGGARWKGKEELDKEGLV